VMLAVTLAGLVLVRVIRARWLAGAAVLVAGWAVTVGLRIVQGELGSIADDLFRPVANAEETFSKTRSTLPEQVLVSVAGRGVVLLVGLLALIGAIRLWRRGCLDRSVLVLGAAPAVVPLATSFGGEVIFRVYLFAYYGKDQQYAFTDEEVAAALWVADQGPHGSLLVVGSRNYPGQSRNYEHFVSVAIDREPANPRTGSARSWPIRPAGSATGSTIDATSGPSCCSPDLNGSTSTPTGRCHPARLPGSKRS